MRLKPNPNRLWRADQVRVFVKDVIDRVGPRGWDFLSPEMRAGMIAQKAMWIVSGLERGEIPCAAIACLHRDMLRIAGLMEEEE